MDVVLVKVVVVVVVAVVVAVAIVHVLVANLRSCMLQLLVVDFDKRI